MRELPTYREDAVSDRTLTEEVGQLFTLAVLACAVLLSTVCVVLTVAIVLAGGAS